MSEVNTGVAPAVSGAHLPRVSIGLPVYDGEKYLRRAVESILDQDFTDFELILSDNASTDDTGRMCCEYASSDSRVRYFRNERNIGAAPNHRRVFELARAPLFKWASYDDIHLPGFLSKCMEMMECAPPSVVLVAPWAEMIDEYGEKITTRWLVPERLETRRQRPHQRLADVLRKVAWSTAQYGLFRSEQLRRTRLIGAFPHSDHVLLAEVALLGEIWQVPEVLFQRRHHPSVSHMVNRTHAEFLEWLDTSQDVRKPNRAILPLMPRWQILNELERSVARAPVKGIERLQCFITAFWVWLRRELVRLLIELRGYVKVKQRIRGLLQRLRIQ